MAGRLGGIATCFLMLVGTAHARDVSFPIELDPAFLRTLLMQQVYIDEGDTARVWRDAQGCTELTLSNPDVGADADGLTIVSAFDGRLGAGIGQLCLGVTRQQGLVEVRLQPQLHPRAPVVEFRVVDSHLYDVRREKRFSGRLWDWVKSRVHPRLESFRVDLRRPIAELQVVLPLFLPRHDLARTQRLLDSIALSEVSTKATGLSTLVHLVVEAESLPSPLPTPEPTLTIEEVQRWEAAWQSWDAFLTFIIKRAGKDAVGAEAIGSLRDILLEARYDLLPALRPSAADQADPVRPLFLRTWRRLAPVLRQLSIGVPGEAAVRYLSFIAAADALAALDDLGPEFGFHISADGLRRLARTVDPAGLDDPTRYSEEVDPELRQLFGFGEPLSVPELPAQEETPAIADSDETPEEGGAAETPLADPRESPTPVLPDEFLDEPPVPPGPQSWWRWLEPDRWLVGTAWAAVEPAGLKRLHRWVPQRSELQDYLRLVRQVLVDAREEIRAKKKIDAQFAQIFEPLVLATAWQESCWRQFIRRGGQVQTITSPVGALGIMQVNAKVWRGFYDVEALRADMAYNARAGSEIVQHYLIDYAVKKGEHKVRGNLHDLARATYSAYNAGPGRLSRYRKGTGHKIDAKFWDKYQQVLKGNEMAVVSCYGA